jgi:hypothetical protein
MKSEPIGLWGIWAFQPRKKKSDSGAMKGETTSPMPILPKSRRHAFFPLQIRATGAELLYDSWSDLFKRIYNMPRKYTSTCFSFKNSFLAPLAVYFGNYLKPITCHIIGREDKIYSASQPPCKGRQWDGDEDEDLDLIQL